VDTKVITDYIREYVKAECSKTTFNRELYENHILVVADYGAKLAKILGADKQAVELASYLHDFAIVHNFEQSNEHHVKGAKVAEDLLIQFKYSDDIINKVRDAILMHLKPQNGKNVSTEAICLSNADAMSQLAKPLFWLYYGYTIKKKNYNDCIHTYIKSMEDNWQAMIEPAKEMMAQEYAAVQKLK
jgi:uncharacterized protein